MPTSDIITTPKSRLSYPNLFTPSAFEEGEKERYSCTFLIPKEEKKTLKAMEKAVNEVIKEAWGDKPGKVKKPFIDGDTYERKDGTKPEESEGTVILRTSSKFKPGVVIKKGDKAEYVDERSADLAYAGRYAKGRISFFTWEHPKSGKGVSVNIQSVLLLEDGDPFGPSQEDPMEGFSDELEAEGVDVHPDDAEAETEEDSMFN